MIWTFHEQGCIPGIPGTFAGCRVVIADDGTVTTQPLAKHPAPADASADAPTADTTATAPEEPVAEAAVSPTEQSQPEHMAEAE